MSLSRLTNEKTKKHVHKYVRADISSKPGKKYFVYQCADPECNKPGHYVIPALVVNRKTVCWKCGQDSVMTADMATKKKPVCVICKAAGVEDIQDVIADILEKGLPS